MAMTEKLQELFERLQKASFSGTMEIDFHAGDIENVHLHHVLPFDKWKQPIPIVEEPFELKP
jgi:hypothetical protein